MPDSEGGWRSRMFPDGNMAACGLAAGQRRRRARAVRKWMQWND